MLNNVNKSMEYNRSSPDGEFDLEKLPEGVYFFTGKEGFVTVEVNKNGNQSWNLQNWFANLDPENSEEQRYEIIQDIKKE